MPQCKVKKLYKIVLKYGVGILVILVFIIIPAVFESNTFPSYTF